MEIEPSTLIVGFPSNLLRYKHLEQQRFSTVKKIPSCLTWLWPERSTVTSPFLGWLLGLLSVVGDKGRPASVLVVKKKRPSGATLAKHETNKQVVFQIISLLQLVHACYCMLQYPTNEGMWLNCPFTLYVIVIYVERFWVIHLPVAMASESLANWIPDSASWSLEFLGSTQGHQTSMEFKVNTSIVTQQCSFCQRSSPSQQLLTWVICWQVPEYEILPFKQVFQVHLRSTGDGMLAYAWILSMQWFTKIRNPLHFIL